MDKIYGINPVKVFLENGNIGLKKIYVAPGRGGTAIKEIVEIARQKEIAISIRQRSELDKIAGNSNHQGVVGIYDSYLYKDIDVLINNRGEQSEFNLIIILDSVMDPQNLGAIIRSAYCFGANGLIIPKDRAAAVTSAVIKASAGSANQLPVCRITNLSQVIDFLKSRGFWVFGAQARGGENLRSLDFRCHVALILGGEAKGIRPLLRKKCDFLVTIPITGQFDSFNVAVAAGIIQYEIFCQQGRTG
ncbi:MAG TPA: 23S rRNA (guanosine(2251)-2'-O)-methyltransferase RlmB [Deltaproteobacteria bacterium]|nr:23S rRNA (guanosine(2251)-2'-O)-methyltransferase RlmB [Deltaproteobacteria bacterium]